MVRTTEHELGNAYRCASRVIMAMEPVTPRIMGAYWREEFGLHHKHKRDIFGKYEYWIEFPNDRDYTAFMLRFS